MQTTFRIDTMHARASTPASPAVVRYSRAAIAMHWILALALFAQLALGWWMLDVPKSPPGVRAGWFNLHKSIGITLALFVLVRLSWRLAHPLLDHACLPGRQGLKGILDLFYLHSSHVT